MSQQNPLTTSRTDQPDPGHDRSAHAIPPNIAQLLYILRILLQFARHMMETLERRAAHPGFSLIARPFGTAKLTVILAHLQRGILRATALETLLLKRAATGRDLEIKPPRIHPGQVDKDINGSIAEQSARLISERASHDAPIDPDRPPSPQQIEAEVRTRPIGRTIADICRDMGVIPAFCTRDFWEAVVLALACYDGSMLSLLDHMQACSDRFNQEEPDDMMIAVPETVRQVLGFRIGEPPATPASAAPASADNVSTTEQCPTAAAKATGPPPTLTLPRAA